jgi:ribosomal-protein-alanine N-acetyltransferase
MTIVTSTARLHVRHFTRADTAFLLRLLNTEGWLRFIGDRGVRTEADALAYLEARILPGYAEHGFGAYVLERRDTGEAIGISSLVKRDSLDHVDLGYALLPEHFGRGYALEASEAVMRYAHVALGLNPLLAIVQADNSASIALLHKLGFAFEREYDDGRDRLQLFRKDLG